MHSTPDWILNISCINFSIQHPASSIQHPASSIQLGAFGKKTYLAYQSIIAAYPLMPSFLEEVSRQLLDKHGGHLADLTVVFPNRRATLFFRDILSRDIHAPGWSPRLLTFPEFITELSDLRSPDQLTLIFMLYQIYRRESGTQEPFDRFYFWGELLLEDFNEIDKSLVRANDLFANLRDLKVLDAGYDYLTPEQRALVARFWQGFNGQADQPLSPPKQAFLTFWNVLNRVYEGFRAHLQERGLGYEGMMTRAVVESLGQLATENPFPRVAFVGFNAFYAAEEQIVRWFVRQAGADALWDVDAHYVEDPVQEAGQFFRRYRQRLDLAPTLPDPLPRHFYANGPRDIDIVGVPLEVGQAKLVGNVLQELIDRGDFVPERTAIVLPDQNLLFPVLHALPAAIRRVNVTMGYPLRNTSLYSLVEQLLRLQEGKRLRSKRSDQPAYEFHHTAVLAMLRHPYVNPIDHAAMQLLIRRIEDENRIYLRPEELHRTPFLQRLFQPVDAVPETFTYLLRLLKDLHDHITTDAAPAFNIRTDAIYGVSTSIQHPASVHQESPQSPNHPESHPASNIQHPIDSESDSDLVLPVLEKELIYHLYIHVNRLKALSEENQFQFEQTTFLKLFRQLMQSLRLPFTGEPLRGLQIMGVLETRNLDFKHVFILSANEGTYPPREVGHSFVPGNLRRGFGLPTPDQQDAIYAYTFYRLLHRAQRVYLIHNTEDTPALSGEMSRFLYQLLYESEPQGDDTFLYPDARGAFRIQRRTLSAPVRTIPPQPIAIEKNASVLERLRVYTEAGPSGLTPSALNTYLDCRLKFYYKYVAGLRESEGVQDDVDPAVFGNVLHKAMERVYQRHVDQTGQTTMTAEAIKGFKGKPLDRAVQEGFQEHFRGRADESLTLEGRNLIAYDIVRKMANRILDTDAQYAPFEVVSLERETDTGYVRLLPVPVGDASVTVRLKGIIDRVDRKGDTVRVVDYKTGRDEKKVKSIASLFDRDDKQRNKAAMQAMFYAFLYEPQATPDEKITPGLVNAKELFGEQFDPRLILDKHPIDDFRPYAAEFTQALTGQLSEVYDPAVPFTQTEDLKKCDYCPFVRLCY